jgi:hypothetical protein
MLSGANFCVMKQGWEQLAQAQSGMFSRSQLAGVGVTRSVLRAQLAARRWRQRSEHVFSATTGPLSWEQRLWLAALHAGPDALIGGLSAAKVHGMKNWERDEITVLVDDQLSFEPMAGVHFVRTRRPLAEFRCRTDLPLCRLEPAVLLFAGYEHNQRTAHGAIAAAVQQRLTSVKALREWVELLRPLRRARQFRALIDDLAGGAQSLAEVDVRRACREHGVALPEGQRPRRDRRGRRRYTDCEWTLCDGRTLVLEVDGAFHDDVLQAAADRARTRKLTTPSRAVVSCSAYELRYDPGSVMEDLIALGVPRTW